MQRKRVPCNFFNAGGCRNGDGCAFEHALFCNNQTCIDKGIYKNHPRADCKLAGRQAFSPTTNPAVVMEGTVAQGNSAPILSARGGFRPHNLLEGGGGMGQENSEDLSSSDWRAKAALREHEEGQVELAKFEERVYTEGSASFPKYGEMFSAIAGMFLEEEGRGMRDLEELLGGEEVYSPTLIAFEICINVSPDRHEELLSKRQVLQEMVLNICEDEAATNPSPKNTDKG